MYANMKRMNNDMAVSPIVATLVLIVVAVIGAVAVGTIMGTFSTSVSKQVNANGAGTAAATGGNLVIAGSTTVYPASVLLAQDYMSQNPATKITVQGGGSGAGVAAVGQGIVDIGASSSALTQTQLTTYPNLQPYQIGARSVVWIVNKNAGIATTTNVTKADILAFVSAAAGTNSTGTLGNNINTLVQRSDASGTESTAAAYLGYATTGDNAFDNVLITTKPESGNAGVISEINGNTAGNELGFADLGYVFTSSGTYQPSAANVRVLNLNDGTNNYNYNTTVSGSTLRAAALASAKDKLTGTTQGTNWPQGLDSQLLYVTNGDPSPLAKNYIQFAESPAGGLDIQAAGDFANSELV
jgi:phosphate transport system substrate-binding protein